MQETSLEELFCESSGGNIIQPFISVLVVNLDYVLVRTTITADLIPKQTASSHATNQNYTLEPVIRIFGSTPHGQRTCVHLHGFYPYIYFRPENFHHPIFESEGKLAKYLSVFEKSIEDLLHIKRISTKQRSTPQSQYDFKKRKYIHHLEIVKKCSLYGMWSEPIYFIKTVLYDPADITKLGSILQKGSLAGISMEVFESHIPYLLKFTSDFNITTMGWIYLKNVRFRLPLPLPPGTEQKSSNDVVMSSPDATIIKAITPKKSPFSSISPFRSPFHDSLSNEGNSASSDQQKLNPVKLFHSSSVAPEYIWKSLHVSEGKESEKIQHPPTTNAGNVYHTSTGLRIEGNLDPTLLALFEGLKEEDLFSQNQTPVRESSLETSSKAVPLPSKPTWNQPIDFSKKVSSCELEIDSHISLVINSTMKRTEFGAELWEEERIRCLKKNLPMDKPPSLPSTQTVNRTQQQNEKDYYKRFERLQMKGVMLRKTAKELILSQKDSKQSLLLSQYLTADDAAAVTKDPVKSMDSDAQTASSETLLISQWASQAIEKAREDAAEEEKTFQNIAGDVDSIIEDYVKSQRTPSIESIGSQKGLPLHLKALLNDKDEDEELEEEDTQASIDRELEDILTSTQVDIAKDVKEGIMKSVSGSEKSKEDHTTAEASLNAKPPLPPRRNLRSADLKTSELQPPVEGNSPFSDTVDIFSTGGVNQFLYSTPPTDESSSLGIADIGKSKKVKFGSEIIHSPSIQVDSSTAITIGKRHLSDNKLTSVFKKQKRTSSLSPIQSSPSPIPVADLYSTPKKVHFQEDIRQPSAALPLPLVNPDVKYQSEGGVKEQQIVGILLKSAEKKNTPEHIAEKKKFKKSVSFVSKAVNISIEPMAAIAKTLAEAQQQSLFSDSSSSTALISGEEEITSKISSISQSTLHELKYEPSLPISSFQAELYQPTKSMYIVPTFTAPLASSLEPLESYGLPLFINPIARFGLESDAKEFAKSTADHQNANYNQYMVLSHKVVYDKDVPKFTASGMKAPSSSSSSSSSSFAQTATVISSKTLLPKRQRCLIPTFKPPRPEKFRKQRDSLPPSAIQSSGSTVGLSGDGSESTQSSDPNNFLLGSMNEYQEEKMNRLVTLSMELHCKTRKELLANPKYDPIELIVWVCDDIISNAENEQLSRYSGILLCLPAFASGQQHSSNMKASTAAAMAVDIDLLLREVQMNLQTISCIAFTKPEIQIFTNEIDLIQGFCTLTREIIDPDFLIGYESSNQSYGYLIKRGKLLNLNILQLLSRIPDEKPSFRNEIIRQEMKEQQQEQSSDSMLPLPSEETSDLYDSNSIVADVGIFIKGRTFLNTWHMLKSELKLFNNSIHYAVESILQKTLPTFTTFQLTKWFSHPHTRYKTISYIYLLTLCNVLLIEKLDLLRKISECARLYGIDFFSVFHRGSQYRVEAALLVKAHVYDYLLISPSRGRVANQAAMEVIPLVLEPRSHFYTDPVLVLDYQSLYPSMMLAYNLCYSTCMGKLRPGGGGGGGAGSGRLAASFIDPNHPETTGKLGVINYPEAISAINTTLHVKNIKQYLRQVIQNESRKGSSGSLPTSTNLSEQNGKEREKGSWKIDENTPYVSPNGSVFCAKSVRQGILPIMIREMLSTRLMVKRAMKKHIKISLDGKKSNRVLEKVLDARQLAIKLLANVTYGYTGAGFSGRMPMAELADAIVQSARSLLEWTIRTINQHPTWKAEVVYGDTDSVFVHLPGRNLEQAFKIGEEIAMEMTSKTPEDVVLKFEKVYYPCLLVSKKRYVGNCYEYPPPSPEILSRVKIDPNKIIIPRPIESFKGKNKDKDDHHHHHFYGKKTIITLLHKYSIQTKVNNYLFIDAKGIEMIRSDQCLLTQKLQKEILILLFTTFGNLSLIKSYLIMRWNQVLQNFSGSCSSMKLQSSSRKSFSIEGGEREGGAGGSEMKEELPELSFKDYLFYKEVRFGTYASVSSQPPGAIVATKEVLQDEMAIPPYNWKVPYVVVYGLPNTPLKNLVYHPKDILKRGNSLRINYSYYIMKCINPSLDRLLSLCGVNVFHWFQMMTRPKLILRHINYDTIPKELLPNSPSSYPGEQPGSNLISSLLPSFHAQPPPQQQMSMEQFILQRNCLLCEIELAKATKLICEKCLQQFKKFRLQQQQQQRQPNRTEATTAKKSYHPNESSVSSVTVQKKTKPSSSSSFSSSSSVGVMEVIDLREKNNKKESEEGDSSDSPQLTFTEEDMKHYLSFQKRFKTLQIQNQLTENICNDCVKYDTSHHFPPPSSSPQRLQLFAKNEMLGIENCSNISCDIFYARMRLLLDYEDFLLVQHELQL